MIAELSDFEARHGDVDDEDRVSVLLGDASALILAEVDGSEAEWVEAAIAEASGFEFPQEIVSVCVEVAYRAWSNPDALARAEVGDVSTYWRSGLPPDAIYLTDRERRVIHRGAGTSSFRAVTLASPYPPDVDTMDPDDPDA